MSGSRALIFDLFSSIEYSLGVKTIDEQPPNFTFVRCIYGIHYSPFRTVVAKRCRDNKSVFRKKNDVLAHDESLKF